MTDRQTSAPGTYLYNLTVEWLPAVLKAACINKVISEVEFTHNRSTFYNLPKYLLSFL